MTLKGIKYYGYIFIAIALNILFFYPVIFLDKTFFFRDIHRWFYPMKHFLATSFKSGEIPFWCSNYFCGSPFMSDIQSGVFYPLSLIFLVFTFPLSFNIYIAIHFFLGFIFFYNFIVEIGLSRKSALITSISYCYGSYAIASINTLNNLSTLIWLPAILWSFHKGSVKNQVSGYFYSVIFLSMAVLGGEPQIFVFTAGLLFFFGITYARKESFRTRDRLTSAGIILLLIISALVLTMVQLGPTYLDYQQSMRSGGLVYEEARRYSLSLDTLKHLFFPLKFYPGLVTANTIELEGFFPGDGKMPWLLTIYPGLIITLLALLGMIFSFSKRTLLWVVTLFASLLVALGDTTPVYFLFYKAFPFFRFPEKFIFLVSFCLLVMAAYGFDQLISILKKKRMRYCYLFYLITILLVVDLFLAHRDINPVCESAIYRSYHPRLQVVLDDPEKFRIYVDPGSRLPVSIKHTIANILVGSQMFLVPHLGILQNLEHVDGHTPLELLYQYLIKTEFLSKPWEERCRFFRLSNVKYIISSEDLGKNAELMNHIIKINANVYKVKDSLPRAWIIGQLIPIKKNSVGELMSPSFNPASSAFTKGEIVNKHNSPYFKNIDSINYEKNDTIQIELTAHEPGVLVVAESSYPEWKVFVDGVEKECLHLNFFFMGVEIDKGKHNVIFKYRPQHFHLFLLISLISLGLFILAWPCCWLLTELSKKSELEKQQ